MPDSLAGQRIVVTGASGLVGRPLVAELERAGAQIVRLVRQPVKDAFSEIQWDPAAGKLDASRFEGLDAVVHLAGENIAAHRWSESVKQRIRDSRVNSTRLLSEAIARLDKKPHTFLCASAIGFYGDRGDEVLTEASAPAGDFLAQVCREWEAASQPARDAGVRIVNARIGMVVSRAGGALKSMLTPFKLGAGGRMGSGRQYISWIVLDDLVQALLFLLTHPNVSGPVNLVSPNPVTNIEFTKTLGRVLRRPTIFPMPRGVARVLFGEMADAILLSSTRVSPQLLTAAGFQFRHGDLESALRDQLAR